MAAQSAAASRGKRSGSKRVIVLLCNKSILRGFVKVTNLPYLEGWCYVTKPSTWRVGLAPVPAVPRSVQRSLCVIEPDVRVQA